MTMIFLLTKNSRGRCSRGRTRTRTDGRTEGRERPSESSGQASCTVTTTAVSGQAGRGQRRKGSYTYDVRTEEVPERQREWFEILRQTLFRGDFRNLVISGLLKPFSHFSIGGEGIWLNRKTADKASGKKIMKFCGCHVCMTPKRQGAAQLPTEQNSRFDQKNS